MRLTPFTRRGPTLPDDAIVLPKAWGTWHHDVADGARRKRSWANPDGVVIAANSEPSGASRSELLVGTESGP